MIIDGAVIASQMAKCPSLENFFYLCAKDAGYGRRSEDKAREISIIWAKRGYSGLPDFVKNFCIAILNKERTVVFSGT